MEEADDKKEEANVVVSVIGGADGPTSIFVAGRISDNIVPWIFEIAIVLVAICIVRQLKKRK